MAYVHDKVENTLTLRTFGPHANFTPAIIPPVLRGEYIALLEKAHGKDTGVVNFIAERVEETQKDLLRMLK